MDINFDKKYDVVIVGGGPVGLGLAIELGQRGVDVAVIEKSSTLHNIPKGQNLTQRTMEHFQSWGIEKELRQARVVPKDYAIGGMTSYETLLSGYHYDWLQRDLVRPFYNTENERLKVMSETTDGFVLAESDLNQRGPGQFLGSRQSGFSKFQLASMTNIRLIEKARREARKLISEDPNLEKEEHKFLAHTLNYLWENGQGDIS